MRPATIVLIERQNMLSIAGAAVGSVLGWNELIEMAPAEASAGERQGVMIAAIAITLLFALMLLYFIARRASAAAKWLFVAFNAYGVVSFAMDLGTPGAATNIPFVFDGITLVLTLYCAWLLFKPDAVAWLESKGANGPGDPSAFD